MCSDLQIYFTKSLWVIISHRIIRPIRFEFPVLTVQLRPMPLCHFGFAISWNQVKNLVVYDTFFCDTFFIVYTCSNLERIKITWLNIKMKMKKKKTRQLFKKTAQILSAIAFFPVQSEQKKPNWAEISPIWQHWQQCCIMTRSSPWQQSG